jgi:NADPH2:quinone reductase
MKAVGFTRARPVTAEDALVNLDIPTPVARRNDLLIEVKAVSVNPVDTRIRRHDEPLGERRILGYDAAGIVRGVGVTAHNFTAGDQVYYAGVPTRPGTNAEFHLVDHRIVGRRPKSLSFAEAAALPLTSLTAWEMLFDRFKIPHDQSVHGTLLIVGGAGGVGSIAIQLAATLTGLTVVATASRPETIDWCRSLGAHRVINHHHDMTRQFKDLNLSAPDYIFCTTHLQTHWRALTHLVAHEGAIGILQRGAQLDISQLLERSASLHTEYVFARGILSAQTIDAQHRTLEAITHLIDIGALRTTMTAHYGRIDAANLKRAHAAVEAGTAYGKIVLEGF